MCYLSFLPSTDYIPSRQVQWRQWLLQKYINKVCRFILTLLLVRLANSSVDSRGLVISSSGGKILFLCWYHLSDFKNSQFCGWLSYLIVFLKPLAYPIGVPVGSWHNEPIVQLISNSLFACFGGILPPSRWVSVGVQAVRSWWVPEHSEVATLSSSTQSVPRSNGYLRNLGCVACHWRSRAGWVLSVKLSEALRMFHGLTNKINT